LATKHKSKPKRRFHIDRRARSIIKLGEGNDDDLLDTRAAAELLGYSPQFLEIARTAKPPYGPPCFKLSPRRVVYKLSSLREWVSERARQGRAE
jgi:hypothetical protein